MVSQTEQERINAALWSKLDEHSKIYQRLETLLVRMDETLKAVAKELGRFTTEGFPRCVENKHRLDGLDEDVEALDIKIGGVETRLAKEIERKFKLVSDDFETKTEAITKDHADLKSRLRALFWALVIFILTLVASAAWKYVVG